MTILRVLQESSKHALLRFTVMQAWGSLWGRQAPQQLPCTHQKQVHHVILCGVAVLGGILLGLWE